MSASALAPVVAVLALVADDNVSLRAAPRDNAPAQAKLFKGDWLEVRGELGGFLSVYDRRRERPGYVCPSVVKVHPANDAATFVTLAGFLKDMSGFESLGIAYAALASMALPLDAVPAALHEAIGTMADRLAVRASRKNLDPQQNAVLAAHLDVARAWGVEFLYQETEDGVRACYNGLAYRNSLREGADNVTQVKSVLALTRNACGSDQRDAMAQREWLEEMSKVLAQVNHQGVASHLVQRLWLKRADVNAELAFLRARQNDSAGAALAAEDALKSLMRVERALLAEEDRVRAEQTALRVAATRWAAEKVPEVMELVTVEPSPDVPGETCVRAGGTKRCTFGQVWTASATVSPKKNAVAVVVQPTSAWTELWLFRWKGEAWDVEVLLPPASQLGVGYAEAAGFSPDGRKMLVAREAFVNGNLERRFQVMDVDTLKVDRWTRGPQELSAFKRWATPRWLGSSVALRSGPAA